MKYLSMYKFVFFANVFNKLRNNLNASVFFKDWTLMTLKSYNIKIYMQMKRFLMMLVKLLKLNKL